MAMEYEDQINDRVRELKGKTKDVALRFSIAWNEGMLLDNNDLDAHCREPDGEVIFYQHMRSDRTCGNLDVDIIEPASHKKYAVENIVYPNTRQMYDGTYKFLVHCYSCRGGKGGFRAEIEFDNTRYEFHYNQILTQEEKILVADVTLANGNFSINPSLTPISVTNLLEEENEK